MWTLQKKVDVIPYEEGYCQTLGILTSLCLWPQTGNGLGIRVVGGKEVPGCNGDIGAYVAKVLPGGAAEQTGKILEGKLFDH